MKFVPKMILLGYGVYSGGGLHFMAKMITVSQTYSLSKIHKQIPQVQKIFHSSGAFRKPSV
jgi:hypothetical protein